MSRIYDPSFINSPSIGLILRHNQNTDDIFCVPDQLNVIRTYMNRYRKGALWLLAAVVLIGNLMIY